MTIVSVETGVPFDRAMIPRTSWLIPGTVIEEAARWLGAVGSVASVLREEEQNVLSDEGHRRLSIPLPLSLRSER